MKTRKNKNHNKKLKYLKYLSLTSLGILLYILILFLFFYLLNNVTESFQTVLWSFLTLLKLYKNKKASVMFSLAFYLFVLEAGIETTPHSNYLLKKQKLEVTSI